MVSLPPSGMASRALIAMFRMALSSCCASALTVHKPPAVTVSIWMCSPKVEFSKSDMPEIILLASIGCGASGCWRAKASSRCVSNAARSAALAAASTKRSMPKSPLRMRRSDEIVRAHDDAEHIVEIVGDAAGELAERLHFLRLAELVFHLLAPVHLLEQLIVGHKQPVVRGGKRAKRLAGEARDQNARE